MTGPLPSEPIMRAKNLCLLLVISFPYFISRLLTPRCASRGCMTIFVQVDGVTAAAPYGNHARFLSLSGTTWHDTIYQSLLDHYQSVDIQRKGKDYEQDATNIYAGIQGG